MSTHQCVTPLRVPMGSPESTAINITANDDGMGGYAQVDQWQITSMLDDGGDYILSLFVAPPWHAPVLAPPTPSIQWVRREQRDEAARQVAAHGPTLAEAIENLQAMISRGHRRDRPTETLEAQLRQLELITAIHTLDGKAFDVAADLSQDWTGTADHLLVTARQIVR